MPVGPLTPEQSADAPRDSHHRTKVVAAAAVGAVGLAAVVGVGGSQVLDRAHTMLTSATLPSVNSVGTAAPVSNGNPQASAATVDPGVVDINTTLGYPGRAPPAPAWCSPPNGDVLTNNHVVAGRDLDHRHRRRQRADVQGDAWSATTRRTTSRSPADRRLGADDRAAR